jgi:xanthosine utilization system XapX-like protein
VGADSDTLETLSDQLDVITAYIDTEVAAILAAVDTEVAAIKAKTDNLPSSPAAVSDIPSAATVAAAVGALTADTGFSLLQAVKRILAKCDGAISFGATNKIHVIKNKAGTTETTHTHSDTGRAVS